MQRFGVCSGVVAVVLLFAAAPLAAQTIYKCKGPGGTEYSEKPCGPEAEVKALQSSDGWRVSPSRGVANAISDSASIRNAQGHLLQVYRIDTNAVWVRFALNPDTQASLDQGYTPSIQIDDYPEEDLRSTRNMYRSTGITGYVEEAQAVQFLIWHGNEAEGRSTKLKQLMSGRSIRIRYLAGGATEPSSTSFALTNAGSAIAKALGISEAVDTAREARLLVYRQAMVAASRQCLQEPAPAACVLHGKRCSELHSGDAAAFTSCFAQR